MLTDYNYSVLHSNITPQALPCLDWPSRNVSNVPHSFCQMCPKLSLKRIKNLALSNNVALPWLQRYKNSELMVLINVGKTQI